MSDRLERDVEDVLGKIEDFEWHRKHRRKPSKVRQVWNRWWGGASAVIGRRLAGFTAGHLMLAGFVLLLAGVVFRFRGLGTWFVLAGVILFLLGLFFSMRRTGSSSEEPAARGGFWRDRYIQYDDAPKGVRRWLRRRR